MPPLFALRKDLAEIDPAASLPDLLSMSDERFLYCAYRTFLNRYPDELGLATYLPRVRAGECKLNIVRDIASSPEARHLGRELAGLGPVKPRGLISRAMARLAPLWLVLNPAARMRTELRRIENSLGGSIDRVETRLFAEINHMTGLIGGVAGQRTTGQSLNDQHLAQLPKRTRGFFYKLKAAACTITPKTEI